MKQSIVLELQQASLDSSQPTSMLLRKALLVATKLDIRETTAWIEKELAGWTNEELDDVPKFRQVPCTLVIRNPYRGWQQVSFANPEHTEMTSSKQLTTSVSEIEALVANDKGKSVLHMRLNPEFERDLQIGLHSNWPIQAQITVASAKRILEELRDRVLRWALDLEKAGIIGENLSFSDNEKKQASGIEMHFHANAQVGQVGPVHGNANIQLSSSASVDTGELKRALSELQQHIEQSNLEKNDLAVVHAAINGLGEEAKKSEPDGSKTASLMRVVKEFAGSTAKTVSEVAIKTLVDAWLKKHGY